ncbi:GNAT family N-acetyltransferase [Campylobacter hyointestinalis]|uniref:GNAT family N-acetyltransferase n=1 Tax=Campylobacter hyointestinalis TaxID=198 RepID=A0A562XBS6_CAMHY|nr:GNAT family N-acetyltransferase [Campylobacter hyointestinalis]TWO19588.1 GNAT family N-acetyltransferase [Campylobacter hyointestinalis]
MICEADKNDAKEVIELLNLAMEDIAFSLSGTSNLEQSNQILQEFFTGEDNRLSYKNILVFKDAQKVVGAICSYNGLDSKRLDIPFIKRLKDLGKEPNIKQECIKNELYIDSLAVSIDYRGQKIATKLISAVFERAKKLGLSRVSLIVDIKKPKVKRYYESLGFCGSNELEILGHKYTYMTKDLI